MRASSLADLQCNHLLSLLSPESQQRVLPLLTLVTIPVGQDVSRADQPTSTVYFPLSCVTSSLTTVEDGVTMEMATVNRAMERLSNAKLITYTYDRIHIINREQLEKASCECYGVIKRGMTGF